MEKEDIERRMAVLFDFENLAVGFRAGKKKDRLDIHRILERLLEKGRIIVKRAYSDWTHWDDFKSEMHLAGMELIEIPKRGMTGKNSADMRLCVDAMDMCYSKEHINTFVIISGDSDFAPLVAKLRENGKGVIGLGLKDSSSRLLVDCCDEFIFYEDLQRMDSLAPRFDDVHVPKERAEAINYLLEAVQAALLDNREVLWSSLVKETIKRKRPYFDETYHGYRSFSELLEEAEDLGLIELRRDPKSGTYVVVGFARRAGPSVQRVAEDRIRGEEYAEEERDRPAARERNDRPERGERHGGRGRR